MIKTFKDPNTKYSEQGAPLAQVYEAIKTIPVPKLADNGKVLTASDGEYALVAGANPIQASESNVSIQFGLNLITNLCTGSVSYLDISTRVTVNDKTKAWIASVTNAGPVYNVVGASGGTSKTLHVMSHWSLMPYSSGNDKVEVHCALTLIESPVAGFSPNKSLTCSCKLCWA